MTPFLAVPAAGYYLVQKLREKAYAHGIRSGERADVPVVSVGNLLMGGSGKTPFVIHLAELLTAQGRKPAVVSRGYRGTYREACLTVGDGESPRPLTSPDVCGDEPYLIAMRLPGTPVLAARERIAGVRVAVRRFGCDTVILDDGFQHLQLRRDADIVLLNGCEDRMFPLGRLREPLSALGRAHILVFVGHGPPIPPRALKHVAALPIFRCPQIPVRLETAGGPLPLSTHDREEVVLVSGIAHPERFRRMAQELGWVIAGHHVMPDHHAPSDAELRAILDKASGRPIVTTEKDWVKLPTWFTGADSAAALRIGMALENEQAFLTFLLDLAARAFDR